MSVVLQGVAAMGGSAPSDSTATGTITQVAGSLTESGTITIQTLGTGQTSEQITLPSGQRGVVYSGGNAQETTPVNPTPQGGVILELAVVDQCVDFPLPLLVAALSNPDASFTYIGQELLDGAAVQHVQMQNTFASSPKLHKLAAFSVQDLWFDAKSGLLLKLAYIRQAGAGAVPKIPVEVDFSNYIRVGGVLYPMQIQKAYNGTPWQTITIQNVSLNTGLTAAQFQVE